MCTSAQVLETSTHDAACFENKVVIVFHGDGVHLVERVARADESGEEQQNTSTVGVRGRRHRVSSYLSKDGL